MASNKIKVIFMGTPEFAVPALLALINDNEFDLIAVVTQPDKKTGRKQIITSPPVKSEAQKHEIPVYQPRLISDFQFQIADLRPDLIVVAAYAQLIPEKILNIPRYGCINLHASLLPKYRGAACIQAAILVGDGQTGVTVMKMDAGLDTGRILAQKAIAVQKNYTADILSKKLSILGAELLIPTIKQYIAGKIKPCPQDESAATYVKKIKKQDGRVDWHKPAAEIERFIRAMFPWPGAFTPVKNGLMLKIAETDHEILEINKYKTGEIFLHDHDNAMAVQCGQNALILKKIQLAGKKIMTAKEFFRGHADIAGTVLK